MLQHLMHVNQADLSRLDVAVAPAVCTAECAEGQPAHVRPGIAPRHGASLSTGMAQPWHFSPVYIKPLVCTVFRATEDSRSPSTACCYWPLLVALPPAPQQPLLSLTASHSSPYSPLPPPPP